MYKFFQLLRRMLITEAHHVQKTFKSIILDAFKRPNEETTETGVMSQSAPHWSLAWLRHMIFEQHRRCSTLLCDAAAAIIFQFCWKAQEKNTHNILVIVHSQTQFHLSVGNPQETASACQG